MTSSDIETKKKARKNNPELTKESIIIAATTEFSNNGLTGARVDAIAAQTNTAKRMIYYYFGSKEGLYVAVLERAYSCIRAAERGLDLDLLSPLDAIRRLIEFTFDYEEAHTDFIRLVSIENTNHGKYIKDSKVIHSVNIPIISKIGDLIEKGRADGSFRRDILAEDLHFLISSFCFFRVSNQHTLKVIFERDLFDPEVRKIHKKMLVDAVIGLLTTPTAEDAEAMPARHGEGSRSR